MKKVKIFIALLLIICLSANLFGCIQSSKKVDSAKINGSSVQSSQIIQAEFSHGITSPDPDKRLLTYDGKDIKIDYSFENVGIECNLGLLIFVNGIIQPFSTNENNKNKRMHIFNVKKNETRTINLRFRPVYGKSGTEGIVYFAVMLNPKNIADKNDMNKSGNYHRISLLLPWKIKFNNDCKFNIDSYNKYNVEQIDNNIIKKYSSDGTKIDAIKTLLNIKGTENEYCEINSQKDITFVLKVFGDKEQSVRTIVYLDNIPVKFFNGNTYMDWTIKRNSICSYSAVLPQKLSKGKHIIYAITVPAAENYNENADDINKAETITVEIK